MCKFKRRRFNIERLCEARAQGIRSCVSIKAGVVFFFPKVHFPIVAVVEMMI